MTPAISVVGLTRRYRGQLALDQVTFDLEPGSITGLLGRNGAGKTTLMRIVAGHEFASAGTVSVLGASPVENETVLRQMVFVREDQAYPDFRVRHAVQAASWFYPNWSHELAGSLLEEFGLPLNRKVRKLSRGMRSAVGNVIGLAARAQVTLFDEPYAGLDPVSRQLFYDRLLADYAEHPRTVLLSTHLIDEAAGLFERVVVIDRGRRAQHRRRRPARSRDQPQRPGHRRRGVHRRAFGLGPQADRLPGVGGRGRRWTRPTAPGPPPCTCTWNR